MLDDIRTALKRNGQLSTLASLKTFLGGQMVNQQRDTSSSISDSLIQSNVVSNQQNVGSVYGGISPNYDIRNIGFTQSQNETINGLHPQKHRNGGKVQNQNIPNDKRSFFKRTLMNFLMTAMLEIKDVDFNFYQYQNQTEKVEGEFKKQFQENSEREEFDMTNLKKFVRMINTAEFLKNNLNFRLHFPDCQIRVNSISEENVDIQIQSSYCLIVNPCISGKQGIFKDISVICKIPFHPKLLKQPENFDISIRLQQVVLDTNKKFIEKIINWFACLQTMQGIIKVAKDIILKAHYQDQLIRSKKQAEHQDKSDLERSNSATNVDLSLKVKNLNFLQKLLSPIPTGQKQQNETNQNQQFVRSNSKGQKDLFEKKKSSELEEEENKMYENYKDSAIPKRLKVEIVNGIDFILIDEGLPYFSDEKKDQFVFLKIEKFTFQLLRKIQNTYYLIVNTPLIDLSINESLGLIRIEKLTQEIDFEFLRKTNQFPIKNQNNPLELYQIQLLRWFCNNTNLFKQTKLILNQKVNVESIYCADFSPELLHLIFAIQEISNKQQNMKIIKDAINNKLLDEDQTVNKEQVFFDTMNQQLQFKLKNKKDQEKIFECILLKIQKVEISQVQKNNQSQMTLGISAITLKPIQQEEILKSQKVYIRSIALLAATDLRLITEQKENRIFADKMQINVNNETILHFSQEIIEMQLVLKHFQSKKVLKTGPQTQPKLLNVQIEDFGFIWNLSSTRFINLMIKKVSQSQLIESDIKKLSIIKCSSFTVNHQQTTNYEEDEFYRCCFVPIRRKIQCFGEIKEEDKKQEILKGDKIVFLISQDKSDKKDDKNFDIDIELIGQHGIMHLSDDIHFSSILYEMAKQVEHVGAWFKGTTQQAQNPDPTRTTIRFSLKVETFIFRVDENNLKKVFVNKQVLCDNVEFRNANKSETFFKFWKQINTQDLYYCDVTFKRYFMRYEIPISYRNKELITKMVKDLDEARDFIKNHTFCGLRPSIHTLKFDYMCVMARAMQKPIWEFWNVHLKQTWIIGDVNPIENLDLFTCVMQNKIFQKFSMPKVFNRLLTKWYYDTQIDVSRVRFNIQGQPSLLFFNDLFQQVFARFVWEDISRGRDPCKKYLKYLMGIDRSRARMHGILRLSILDFQVNLCPKRQFENQEHYLSISCNDVIYVQSYQRQQLALRQLVIQKENNFQQFETLFLKVPLLELKYRIEVNEGLTVDHFFNQQNVLTLDDWCDRVKNYAQRKMSFNILVNLPSLGHVNKAELTCLYLPTLLQSYASKSAVPIAHFQRSYMSLFNDLAQELQQNRIDISGQVYRKIQFNKLGQNPRYTLNFLPFKLEEQKTKFQAYISDIQLLFSDYKEPDQINKIITSDEVDSLKMRLDDELLSPEEIHDCRKKDNYLERYNGIMIQCENLKVQSEFTHRPNQVNYFEVNDSLIRFTFFRICKITSRNIFKIRHSFFQNQRVAKFQQSMDNYEVFCQFFSIDSDRAVNSNERQSNAIELQEPELDITRNRFHGKAYGVSEFKNLKYLDLKYRQLLGDFKTIFPKYVLTNDQIQKFIAELNHQKSTLYEQSVSFSRDIEESQQFEQNDQDLVEDFIFSEIDTFGTIILTEYRQDQRIKLAQPTINKVDNQKVPAGQKLSNKILVKHLVEIKGVRFLYTKRILELITHHFIKGFDYSNFKKRTYFEQIQRDQQDNHRQIFLEYDNEMAGRRQQINIRKENQNQKNQSSSILNFKGLIKEALVAIKLENAQINFQHNLTQSQLLIASQKPVICVIFAYFRSKTPSLISEDIQLQKQMNDKSQNDEEYKKKLSHLISLEQSISENPNLVSEADLLKIKSLRQSLQAIEGVQRGFQKDALSRDTFSIQAQTAAYTGYQFSTHKDVIKYQVEIEVREMEAYVAPTNIDLQNPTFWISRGQIFEENKDKPSNIENFFLDSQREYGAQNDNLLRKIMFVTNIKFKFDFLDYRFVDFFNPKVRLQIELENLDGQFNGSEWRHFYNILQEILMSRGEKAAEVIMIEQRRCKEMTRMSTDFIRDIINSKLKSQYKNQQNETKPDMAKNISYSIEKGRLRLFDQNQQFSTVEVIGFRGNNLIYSNRESKQDLDISRITIENLIDGDNYRWALCPRDSIELGGIRSQQTMIQCRFKDKFIVVSEAPWRIYDQIEVDILPSSIQLTKNLYQSFKKFAFDHHYQAKQNASSNSQNKYQNLTQRNSRLNDSNLQSQVSQTQIGEKRIDEEEDKKYNLLVPQKFMQPSKSSSFFQKVGLTKKNFQGNKNDQTSQEEMINQNSMRQLNQDAANALNQLQSTSTINLTTRLSQNIQENKDNNPEQKHPYNQGIDNKFNLILSEVTQKVKKDPSNINLQSSSRLTAHQTNLSEDFSQTLKKQRRMRIKNEVMQVNNEQFPVFFKYFRMNEINIAITYFHEKNSFLNSKDLKIKLAPFISHYKFLPFKKMFDDYESHCKKHFISQIPNILKQKLLKAKQKVDEVTNVGITTSLLTGVTSHIRELGVFKVADGVRKKKKKEGSESEEFEEEDEQIKQQRDLYLKEVRDTRLREARKILFGDFATF